MKKGTKKLSRIDIVEEVIKLRLQMGYTNNKIIEYLKEKGFAQTTSYEILRDAQDKIRDVLDKDYSKHIEEDIQRFEVLYSDAIESGNKKEAREVLKEISKLKGHYQERINISGNVEYVVKFPGLNTDEN